MSERLNWICALTCVLGTASLPAATLIEQVDGESTMIMYVEGSKFRTDTPSEDSYAIVDYEEKTFLVVNDAERKVMDMSAMTWREDNANKTVDTSGVDADLQRIGAGPRIAGYDTVHYVVRANGRKCQELFTSRAAFRDSGMAEFWNSESAQAMTRANLEYGDDCELAEFVVTDPDDIGFPLRTVQADGQAMEVLRIERNVQVPGSGFEAPANYERVDFGQMMGQMMKAATVDASAGAGDEVSGEDFGDEEYVEEEYAEEDLENAVAELEQAVEEAAEDEDLGEKVKGLFKRFKKKDQEN